MIRYTVRCTFEKTEHAPRWVAWLRRRHLREVLEAGATSAEVVRLDDAEGGVVYEVHYSFPDRATFRQYELQHAPALREKGLKKFPPEAGLKYQRSVGEVVASLH